MKTTVSLSSVCHASRFFYNTDERRYAFATFSAVDEAVEEVMQEYFWRFTYEAGDFGPEDEETRQATLCKEALKGPVGICIGDHRKETHYIRLVQNESEEIDWFLAATFTLQFATDCGEYEPGFVAIKSAA